MRGAFRPLAFRLFGFRFRSWSVSASVLRWFCAAVCRNGRGLRYSVKTSGRLAGRLVCVAGFRVARGFRAFAMSPAARLGLRCGFSAFVRSYKNTSKKAFQKIFLFFYSRAGRYFRRETTKKPPLFPARLVGRFWGFCGGLSLLDRILSIVILHKSPGLQMP